MRQRTENEGEILVGFKKGFLHGIPIGLGYFSVAFTFGIMSISYGLSIWQAVLISMTNLTSAGQFAGLTVMTQAGGLIEMALTQLVINSRYALMSISLAQKAGREMTLIPRLFFGAFHTDEIFAVAIGQPGKFGKRYFLGLIIAPYLGWSLGTLVGAICGNILPAIVSNALGVALYGMFIAIFVPAMKKSRSVLLVVLLVIAFSCAFKWLPILSKVSGGFAVIICAVIASLIGAWLFPMKEEEGKKGGGE